MTVRPGNTLRDYIKGKRIYHFNPLLFLILTGGFASFLFAYFHIKLPVKEISLEKIEHFSGTLAHKYFAVVGLIFIFLLTATDYIFYFRKKYLLPELVVSNTFQVGQILVFTIALFPLLILQNYVTQKYQVTFEMRIFLKSALLAFLFISRYQFYEAKGNYKLITKIVLQLILVFVLYNNIIAELIVYWQK